MEEGASTDSARSVPYVTGEVFLRMFDSALARKRSLPDATFRCDMARYREPNKFGPNIVYCLNCHSRAERCPNRGPDTVYQTASNETNGRKSTCRA